MKVFYSLLFLLFMFTAVGQDLQYPPSWSAHESQITIPEADVLQTFDHDALLAEDTQIEQDGGRTNNGRVIFEQIDINSHGVWNEQSDGSKIWIYKFKTEGAIGVSALFEQYNLPVGGELYIWSADKSYSVGPYDHTENNDHGKMSTVEVFGDEAVLEYYQPADVVGEPTLVTYGMVHYYRYIYDAREDWGRGSDACQVDVNCIEGHGWEGMRDATVRLSIVDGGFSGLCSGVLVNTTARDCRQYLLTALHCADGLSNDEWNLFSVRFNYERTLCGAGAAPSTHNRTGVIFLADSNDGGGASGSDFLLVEIEDDIPSIWAPFYAGWDATGNGSGEGTCTHHPSGDRKKISTYTTNTQSVWVGAPGSHWQVTWSPTETNHGVTEGGSSGSPLWNMDKQIIGTLTGGWSFCDDPFEPDVYGKMSYHWDGNSNPTDDLKDWLDPEGTGEEQLFGNYAPDCDEEWVGLEELEFSDLDIYPNPADDVVNFQLDRNFTMEHLTIYDAMGKIVRVVSIAYQQTTIDVKDLDSGIYYFTFETEDEQQITKKVTIQ